MTPSDTSFPAFCSSTARAAWHGRTGYVMVQAGGDMDIALSVWISLADAPAPLQRLHYMLLAPQLLSRSQLRVCLAQWGYVGQGKERQTCAPSLPDELCSAWPPSVPGYHRLFLQQGRLVLTLIAGDVADGLAQLEARVDHIVLGDNRLSTAPLLRRLGRLAAPQAQLLVHGGWAASISELAQAGFDPDSSGAVPRASLAWTSARFSPGWASRVAVTAATPSQRRAIVIGAGLAGSATCERLTSRGWEVMLIDRHERAAQESSGNLAGVFMPSVSVDDNPAARLTRAAFLFAQQVWNRIGVFDQDRQIGSRCGVLQVARDTVQAAAFERAARHWQYPPDYAQWVTAEQASARVGLATGSGWLFPEGGWMRPGALCEALLAACGARLQTCFDRQVLTLRRTDDQWQAEDDDGIIARAPVVILATGTHARELMPAASLPLHAMRGQVSHVPAALLPELPLALCGDGYLTGAVDGLVSLGASYDKDADSSLRLSSHTENLFRLQQLLPGLVTEIHPVALQGRVGFRSVSADRLPLVGMLPEVAALMPGRELLLRDVPRWPQCFGVLGYASRGLIWAPLAAEIVACVLEGEPAPLGKDLLGLLDPARFALRAHRKVVRPEHAD